MRFLDIPVNDWVEELDEDGLVEPEGWSVVVEVEEELLKELGFGTTVVVEIELL